MRRVKITYEDMDDCCWIDAGTAAAGVGLPGLILGTNTGAFTACAGRAGAGVGESGGLCTSKSNTRESRTSGTYAGEGASRWIEMSDADRPGRRSHAPVDGSRYNLYLGIYNVCGASDWDRGGRAGDVPVDENIPTLALGVVCAGA